MSDLEDPIPLDDGDNDASRDSGRSKITYGSGNAANNDPLDIDLSEPTSGESKIRAIGVSEDKKASKWKRQPNLTGTGATHVRTFFAKTRVEGFAALDEQINAWLDEHPEFEIKFVTTSVGELIGKTKEAALFVNVWV